ncbi:kinase-like domain-containing protein, partial [Xylogone sp. PMI_703]
FVEFFGWFEDEEHVFLAMEYFPYGTLDKFIKPSLTERDAQIIALQVLEGMRIMHEERFTHRDLKPQNVFVVQKSPQWWVKIGDFGISKRVANNDTALRTSTGTPSYIAPEIFHYVPLLDDECEAYTNAVDMWSFGCVVYEMLALQVPFIDWPKNLVAYCNGGQFPDAPLKARSASSKAIDFVQRILTAIPSLRPTAQEALNSFWL